MGTLAGCKLILREALSVLLTRQYDTSTILSNFDPETLEADRRLLFEVTGLRLEEAEEFDGSDSDSRGDEELENAQY